ncbi:MAG: hypothetical protein H8K10_18110 [Nitrospira sp.]|nr:hypothetical protein [Nitrospira sp.]
MQRIFLSYTYRPHPDHAAETDNLQRVMRRVIEAVGLRVVDGQDLGGRALDAEIEKRITEADALVALFTPQADEAGNKVIPEFVSTEFQRARALNKLTLRIVHKDLAARGLGSAEERVQFQQDKLLDVVMKLLQTLAVWKQEHGRPVQIQIQPDHLATQFGNNHNDRCEYELLIGGGHALQAQTTKVWPEPGAAYVYVPNFVEGAKVRIRLTINGESWQSPFVLPQMGGVILAKVGG